MVQELSQLYKRRNKRISAENLKLAENIDEVFERNRDFIDSLKKQKRKIMLRESLGKQEEIADIVQEAEQNGYRISYFELMGVLALRHGIGNLLYAYSNSFGAMAAKNLFSEGGQNSNLRMALQDNLSNRIKGIMKASNVAINSLDITNQLGLRADKSNLIKISPSLNLLEILKEVVRLPTNSTIVGGPYMWIHLDYRHTISTIPEWNAKYTILKALEGQEYLTLTDLAKDPRIKAITPIKTCLGFYEGISAQNCINDLIATGLVEQSTAKINKRMSTVYKLTNYGNNLLSQTNENGFLDEDLRLELLGEKYEGLKPSELMALRRIRRISRIYANLDRINETYRLAHKIGEEPNYIESIRSGRDPLRFFKEITLRNKFYPLLSPEEKAGLEIYLQTRTVPNRKI